MVVSTAEAQPCPEDARSRRCLSSSSLVRDSPPSPLPPLTTDLRARGVIPNSRRQSSSIGPILFACDGSSSRTEAYRFANAIAASSSPLVSACLNAAYSAVNTDCVFRSLTLNTPHQVTQKKDSNAGECSVFSCGKNRSPLFIISHFRFPIQFIFLIVFRFIYLTHPPHPGGGGVVTSVCAAWASGYGLWDHQLGGCSSCVLLRGCRGGPHGPPPACGVPVRCRVVGVARWGRCPRRRGCIPIGLGRVFRVGVVATWWCCHVSMSGSW